MMMSKSASVQRYANYCFTKRQGMVDEGRFRLGCRRYVKVFGGKLTGWEEGLCLMFANDITFSLFQLLFAPQCKAGGVQMKVSLSPLPSEGLIMTLQTVNRCFWHQLISYYFFFCFLLKEGKV